MVYPLALSAGELAYTNPCLTADLWFAWKSPQPSMEVVLVTVDGTIAGAFPRAVDNGERIPIHRKFLRGHGTTTWYLRVAAGATALRDLQVWVELRDVHGWSVSTPLCEASVIQPHRVHGMQGEVQPLPQVGW